MQTEFKNLTFWSHGLSLTQAQSELFGKTVGYKDYFFDTQVWCASNYRTLSPGGPGHVLTEHIWSYHSGELTVL
jgi:hypothetical protein